MQYFKNVELASLYPVSEGAVRKWISLSEKGKLELQLVQNGDKNNIANTASNIKIIEELVEKGKKYKNGRGKKKITPKQEFYKVFDKRQIVDIINNIETYNEIPLAYSYFNGGAEYWDKYSQKLAKEDGNNMLISSLELLTSNYHNIENIIKNYSKVNIVDLGPGNGFLIKNIISDLCKKEKFGRYIAIDESEEMLNILETNISSWFDNEIKIEKVIKDFSSEKFDDVLVEENLKDDSHKTLNLILMLGGTLANFRNPEDALRVTRNSMSSRDILITSGKLDTKDSRIFFDFNPEEELYNLSPRHKMVPDLLGIEDNFYEVKQEFDTIKKLRLIKIKLKFDLDIQIETNLGTRKIELHKNKEILLWRYWHQDYIEMINKLHENSFSPLLAAKTSDEKYILTVCKVNCED